MTLKSHLRDSPPSQTTTTSGLTNTHASVSPLLSGSVVAVRERTSLRRSALDAAAATEVAAEAAFEIPEATEAEESVDVLVAVEGAEHSGEVVGRSDLGAEAAAEWLAAGATAEIVVAACAGRGRA